MVKQKQLRCDAWIIGVMVTAVWLLGCTQSTPSLTPTSTLTPCRLEGGQTADCGVITVPENRAEPNGHQIKLAVAVIPAVSNAQARDPLFLLAGGPGQSAIEAFGPFVPLLKDIRRNRDLVLIDQRGTGDSNPLTCANFEDVPLDATPEETFAAVDVCLADLQTKADLAYYLTEAAAQDLEDVRLALGYEQINLYGVSYGSRLALEYMHLYPQAVRTVVLDAVVSRDFVIYQDVAQDGLAALQAMFTRCAAAEACATQFPDLPEEYHTILERLESPQQVEVIHPNTGEQLEIELTPEMVGQIVFNLLYSADTVSLLPLLIHQAYAQEDYAPLLAQGLMSNRSGSIAPGLFYTIGCTEDVPLLDDSEAERSVEEETFRAVTDDFQELCTHWLHEEPDPAWREPVTAAVPTLLLSGRADPITPPHYAEIVAADLPHSLHLVVEGYGHGVLTAGCMLNVVTDFIEAGTLDELDTSCLENLSPPPFFVDFTGPLP